MPQTKRRTTQQPGQFIRDKGKVVAVVLTMDEYKQLIKPHEPRLDERTLKSLEATRRKLERGEKVGISIEEAFPDLMDRRNHRSSPSRP